MLGIRRITIVTTGLTLLWATTLLLAQQTPGDGPQFQGTQVAFPQGYREWVFLSAGLGMNYGPNAPAAGQPQDFTNVFVNPTAYRAFMKTGAWPDRTMFVLEIRESSSHGSINTSGHYQTAIRAIEANVKDARLPGGWGFFDFAQSRGARDPLPQSASCYACHAANGAVEHTFVQFYPDLMDVARQMKTVRPDYREHPPAQ